MKNRVKKTIKEQKKHTYIYNNNNKINQKNGIKTVTVLYTQETTINPQPKHAKENKNLRWKKISAQQLASGQLEKRQHDSIAASEDAAKNRNMELPSYLNLRYYVSFFFFYLSE